MQQIKTKHTALLIFMRSAKAESQAKSFVWNASAKKSEQIAKRLNKHILALGHRTNLPVIIGDEQIQQGNTFGDRFQSALQHTFNQGFERIIAIGNDCLELSVQTIQASSAALETQDIVLGPTYDGGVYLFGLNKRSFEQLKLESLPWQTAHLYSALINQCSSLNLKLQTLHVARDADDHSTLLHILTKLPSIHQLKAALLNLLQPTPTIFIEKEFHFLPCLGSAPPLRGPPII